MPFGDLPGCFRRVGCDMSRREQKNASLWSSGEILKIFGKFAREPLLHFLIIGAALFVVFQFVDDTPKSAVKNSIVISQTEVDAVVETFMKTWRRPPNESELDSLVEDRIREEVFVREALALGLDQNDAVVRRRLRQKMEFLTSSIVEAMEPDEAEIREYFEDNKTRFERAGRVAFEQVFLGEAPAEADIESSLEALRSGAEPGEIGVGSLIPSGLPLSSEHSVDGTFGRGFYERLVDITEGMWAGPVISGYGTHIVRVSERQPPASLPLDTIREEVLQSWRAETQKELLEQHYRQLRSRYEISVPSGGTGTAK